MFYETWANMQENYYSQDFHGTDWKEIKNRYEKFIPHVTSRDDLRQLLNDMLGELNSSHQGFSSAGEEEETFYNLKTAYTGIIFQSDKPYTVKRVINQSPAHKRNINIREGDILTKVNGKKVDNQRNRETYFLFTSLPEEINLIFERDGAELAVNLHPESYNARTRQLYDEWIERNQKIVDSASNERIAYIHMKNMGSGSLRDFKIEISNELHYRDALILDLRYNRGGNVHDDVLQLLSQKPYLQWKYRQGDFAKQPNFYPAAKPIILLINEQTLSDAEMTAEGFKQLGLGKIIGTETYRWIIFTSGKRLVDGSYYRLPSWGCYTLDGKDLEMTGVSPDIYVGKSFKEKIGRQYPQLRRAVEVIMNQLNNK
jgi:tricorn protease